MAHPAPAAKPSRYETAALTSTAFDTGAGCQLQRCAHGSAGRGMAASVCPLRVANTRAGTGGPGIAFFPQLLIALWVLVAGVLLFLARPEPAP